MLLLVLYNTKYTDNANKRENKSKENNTEAVMSQHKFKLK